MEIILYIFLTYNLKQFHLYQNNSMKNQDKVYELYLSLRFLIDDQIFLKLNVCQILVLFYRKEV